MGFGLFAIVIGTLGVSINFASEVLHPELGVEVEHKLDGRLIFKSVRRPESSHNIYSIFLAKCLYSSLHMTTNLCNNLDYASGIQTLDYSSKDPELAELLIDLLKYMNDEEKLNLIEMIENSVNKPNGNPQVSKDIQISSNEAQYTTKESDFETTISEPEKGNVIALEGSGIDTGSSLVELPYISELGAFDKEGDEDCLDEDGIVPKIPVMQRPSASLGHFDEFPDIAKENRNKDIDIGGRAGKIGPLLKKKKCQSNKNKKRIDAKGFRSFNPSNHLVKPIPTKSLYRNPYQKRPRIQKLRGFYPTSWIPKSSKYLLVKKL